MPSIAELTKQSSLIFSGTVEKLGGSTVSVLKSEERYAIVRVEQGFFVDPALGNLSGRLITVVPTAGGLRVGEKAVFFTLSLIHGGGIAVREIEWPRGDFLGKGGTNGGGTTTGVPS